MEYNQRHIESFYESIQEKKKEQAEHIEIVQKLDNEIHTDLLEYRINSVVRVLEYMRKTDRTVDYDRLITHCLNKLNGNIDSITLSLEGE